MTAPAALDPGRGLLEGFVTLPDGRRSRVVTAGAGSPLVVFEAGMGAAASEWVSVQRDVAQHTATLAYDRAGFGGSDADPQDRTLERLVDDLAAVLDASGVTEPVVLVGHSWGGPVLRLFCDRHPERVAGLVFVDATIAVAMPEKAARSAPRGFAVMALLLRLRLRRLVQRAALPQGAPEMAQDDLDIVLRDFLSVEGFGTARREAQQIAPALPTLHRLEGRGLPDVPAVALLGGRVDRGMKHHRPLMNDTTAQLMARSPQGRTVVVDGAGHLVPQEKPAATAAAVLDVVTAVRDLP